MAEKEEKEKCVLCGEETEYYRNTPINLRNCYTEGSGQLCEECWGEIYPTPEQGTT